MRPVRFGLIGYGAWGSHHARALAQTPGAELTAIAAHSAATCERARAEQPAARVYTNYQELLLREELDAVDVVVPSYLHHVVARAVLETGRHLLVEKPMALTLDECDDLIALARSRGLLLAVGHELRLSPLWGTVKQMAGPGGIGTPQYALIELWRRPYRPGSEGWRYDARRVGNWILEEPIHFFDLARWYFAAAGEPVSVYARASARQPGDPGLQDNFSAVVNFAGGAYAVVTQTLAAYEHHQVVKLTGTSGALWATWSGETDRTFHPTYSLMYYDGRAAAKVPIPKPTGEVFELQEQTAMMARAVREGRLPAATGEDGRWAVALCLAAQHSVETAAAVDLKAFLGGRHLSEGG
jgi:myo-inositol 2-dehydrogenase/D-chiro-inositol 1-dehydrogenase